MCTERGNVPLSVRTSAYSSAYHYPLKEGSNYANRDDHNWDRSCTAMMSASLPARHGRHRCLNQVTSTMAADLVFSPLWTCNREQGSFYSNTVSQHRKLNTTQTETNINSSFNANINPLFRMWARLKCMFCSVSIMLRAICHL